ncbi:MAG: bifunctional hydroxymethylpyrimidine kinase/phosphomethylpyrimidine kinase [Alphaproteobacteria bacterium]|jgi:rfaE bifunctional protein kinase chain/domain|nr:bifunctional hydroxymethylpyrimidine kinase/phosphomethylpyrimidine kinase [Alphaproteobacteria bacterium]
MAAHERYLDLLNAIGGRRIAVIGDVMLDRSVFGDVERLSAEAPIPIVDVTEETFQLGGAANVVNNLNALGEDPVLFSVIGDDQDGYRLLDLVGKSTRGEQFIFPDASRPTTVKMRMFAQSRQIARADFETRAPVDETIWSKMTTILNDIAPTLSALIIEDYNKGLLPSPFIDEILKIAKRHGLMVLVDPKFDNFFSYQGVTVFKPNLREASEALAMRVSNKNEIETAIRALRERMACDNVMVTLGADGVALVDSEDRFATLPAFVRVVNDPAGAGDTVISVMASAMAAGGSPLDAMGIANYGGGLICEKVGIQPVTPTELRAAVLRHADEG